MSFGGKLKRLRESLPGNVTQEDLAERVGLSAGAIRNYEQGIRYPRTQAVKALARFFGLTMEELLAEDEPGQEESHPGRPPKRKT